MLCIFIHNHGANIVLRNVKNEFTWF